MVRAGRQLGSGMRLRRFQSLSLRISVLVRFVLALIGVVFVLIATRFTTGTVPSLTLFSLGTASITSSVVSILSSIFGTDLPSQIEERIGFQRSVYESGLERVFTTRSEDSLSDEIKQSRRVDALYNTGKRFSLQHGGEIADAIRLNGCKVRILIIDPRISIARDKNLSLSLCPGTDIRAEASGVIASLEILANELGEDEHRSNGGSLEVRTYSAIPTCSILIIDGENLLHTPYLPYLHSSQVPTWQISGRRGSLLATYSSVFEHIWNGASAVIKVDL